MIMNIIASLDAIGGNIDHYLIKARQTGSSYFDEFLDAADSMRQIMRKKEFKNWLRDKMLVRSQPFDEKTFIQYAVETAVIRYFFGKCPIDFQVEVKIRPGSNKDVDCRFKSNGFVYNVEVKCADFTEKKKFDAKTGIKIETIGRLSDHRDTIDMLMKILEQTPFQTKELREHHEMKNMDNKMKDFLESAQGKFNPNPPANELNVLVVACDDAVDMQRWYYYLYAEQGLFTANSFADDSLYNNVDVVVFTNLFFRQSHFFEKRVADSWSMATALNLVFPNPLKKAVKGKATYNFLSILDHFSFQLQDYKLPSDVPNHVKNSVRITTFITEYLQKEKGIFLFELPMES
jgi:hypothetical protein